MALRTATVHENSIFVLEGLNTPPTIIGRLGGILKYECIDKSAPPAHRCIKIYKYAQTIAEMRAHRSRLNAGIFECYEFSQRGQTRCIGALTSTRLRRARASTARKPSPVTKNGLMSSSSIAVKSGSLGIYFTIVHAVIHHVEHLGFLAQYVFELP